MKYNWSYGIHDLAGRNNAWLRSACRERGIKASRMTRKGMQAALLDWEDTQR